MNCTYCDQIVETDPTYDRKTAVYDLGSAAPRCSWHWRFLCAQCGRPAHFMSLAFCPNKEAFFCRGCAPEDKEIAAPFWAWKYYFSYRSPWSGKWQPALDRLEYEGRHPLQGVSQSQIAQRALDPESYLIRYPLERFRWSAGRDLSDDDIQANWNLNARRWNTYYDEDGDPNRRYYSDEPMLAMLGDVDGRHILDAGSGNGYLCRKLAKQGAVMTGVELADEFLAVAKEQETAVPLGITYHHGSISEIDFLPDAAFDKAVCNYVLMDVSDFEGTLRQIHRVLRPGGIFVSVISHPCFACGPGGWVMPAPDSPRREDLFALQVDNYFQRGPHFVVWGPFDPVAGFHRPLRDYWQAFTETGFNVEGFEEPEISERGRRELPPSRIEHAGRVTWSCIFKLRKR